MSEPGLPIPAPAPGSWLVEAWRFLKAQLSSSFATLIDWGLLAGCIALFGDRSYPIAVALGHLGGGITDFSVKRRFVFDSGDARWGGMARRYAFASLSSLAWNELLTYLAVDHLGLPATPSALGAAVIVGAAWNYPLHRLFVFRRPAAESSTEG